MQLANEQHLEPVIRLAQEADIAIITQLDTLSATSDIRRRSIERWVSNGWCYVADIDTKIVAYAVLDPYFYEEHAFIAMLMVGAHYRRRGIGRLLIRRLEALATKRRIFTSTNQSNIAMQALLKICGYEHCGTIHHLDEGDPELVYVRDSE